MSFDHAHPPAPYNRQVQPPPRPVPKGNEAIVPNVQYGTNNGISVDGSTTSNGHNVTAATAATASMPPPQHRPGPPYAEWPIAPASYPNPAVAPNSAYAVSTETRQQLPGYDEAKQSVLNQMVTSQDFGAPTTPAPSPQRGGGKTGSRRSRGHRRGHLPQGPMPPPQATPSSDPNAPPPVRKNKGGRPRGSKAKVPGRGSGIKRKRSRRDSESIVRGDSDSSEIINSIPAQSRSGRRIVTASAGTPTRLTPTAPASAQRGPKKRGKRGKQKPGDSAVCKNCGRGYSPSGNMIVFCDGCNTPWHQYCHDPPISNDVVRIEDQEWLCADCLCAREAKEAINGRTDMQGKRMAEKRDYLRTLSQEQLISLLIHATTEHPDLPLLAPPQPQMLASTPPPPAATATEPPLVVDDEDETELLYPYSEIPPLPYPRAGNGIRLPPESEDLHILIDDNAHAFSHSSRKEGSRVVDAAAR